MESACKRGLTEAKRHRINADVSTAPPALSQLHTGL